MLDGRVKTLHPAVHGGILAKRDDASHMAALKTHAIGACVALSCAALCRSLTATAT
jgi:phosphoribosylaminoimidazolecarboxamide formyltransferase/IMP cyclohydrolase